MRIFPHIEIMSLSKRVAMKKIIVALASICFFCQTASAQPFDSILGTTFQDFTSAIYQENISISPSPKIPYADFKNMIKEKWGLLRETRGGEWVQYNADYTSRSTLNFIRGTLEIEVIVANNTKAAQKEARQEIQRQFVSTHIHCQEHLGFGLFSGLQGNIEIITRPNLPKEAFPQLFPPKKKEEPKDTGSQAATTPPAPKRPTPKSYVDEMRMRKANPAAFADSTSKSHPDTPSYMEYGLKQATALSQYVTNGPNVYPKKKIDDRTPPHVTVTHIIADTSLLEDDTLQIEDVQTVICFKIFLPEDYLQKARSQYKELIHKYGQRYGVATNVIYAIMHTESTFNPFARSHVPAYGLMQLVPSSGGRDAYNYVFNKDIKPSSDFLYEAENNILLGTAYFSKVKDIYFKNIANEQSAYIASVAAYNTGIGNVAKAIIGTTNIKEAVKIINTMRPHELYEALQKYLPYAETKGYLKYILSRSEIYYEK